MAATTKNEKNEQLVWYVVYGSNMQEERFMLYINGDPEAKPRSMKMKGCKDKTPPRKSIHVIIPGDVVFAKHGPKKWDYMGVAFYVPESNKKIHARAWLITDEQFYEIQRMEGSKWYQKEIIFEAIEGIPARTITNPHIYESEINPASPKYMDVINLGEKQTRNLPNEPFMLNIIGSRLIPLP